MIRHMKICMHGLEISPSKENVIAGGVPNNVIRLLNALNDIEINLILVTNDRKFREMSEKNCGFTLPGSDVHLTFIGSKYASIRYLIEYLFKTVQKIMQINKKEKVDIIHGHSGHLGLALVTEIVSRLTRIPAIHTIYCPIDKKGKSWIFYKYFLNNVKEIIAISDNVKYSLNKIGISPEKIRIIPPMVDFSLFRPNVGGKILRSKFGISDEFTILYLGNLTETKGFDIVLDALNIVKKKYSGIRLFSGIELSHSGTDIKKKEILNKIEEYDLLQNIIELGLIKNVEMFMDAADVVVAPFLNTFTVADYPLVILESMAVGTPVITTRVGGIPEIIKHGENGLLISSAKPRPLSDEIMYLINNPRKGKEIGKRAASFVREKFSEKMIAEKTKRIYERVLYE